MIYINISRNTIGLFPAWQNNFNLPWEQRLPDNGMSCRVWHRILQHIICNNDAKNVIVWLFWGGFFLNMLKALICLWKAAFTANPPVSLSCGEFQFGCKQTSGPASMSYFKSITGWLEKGTRGRIVSKCASLNKRACSICACRHTHTHRGEPILLMYRIWPNLWP